IVFIGLLIDKVFDNDDSPPILPLVRVGGGGPMPRSRNGGKGGPPAGGGGGGLLPNIGGGGGGGGGNPLPFIIGGGGCGPLRSVLMTIIFVSSCSFNSSKLRSCTCNLRSNTFPTIYSH